MLRSNLATRPFYNDRAVYLVLGVVAVVGLVVLYVEVGRIIELSRLNTERTRLAEDDERAGTELSVLAAEIQGAVGPQVLDDVAAAVREVNVLIERRAFSWTDFFNRIETTLPPDVMLTEVSPDIEPGSIEVTMGVLGRRLDDINEFIDALEEPGAFTGVLERRSEITEDGMYRAVLVGQYLQGVPPGDTEADASSPASTSDGAEEVRPEADADSVERVAKPVDRDRLPDSDDGPSSDGGDQASAEAATEDAGPDIEPAPTPGVPGGGFS